MDIKHVFSLKSLIFTFLLSYSISASSQNLSLTASLGTTTGSFSTLRAAFSAINAGTHRGVIVITINASTTETSSAVLNASGSGSASYTSINIYPTTTGLSISGNLDAPLIDLNGADNVTIDGRVNATGSTKSLTISNTSTLTTAGTSTIRFIGDAGSNTVKYCLIKGSSLDPAAGVIFFSTATTSGNDNNTIDQNDITAATDANRPLNAINALGTDTKNNDNNVISNNNIYDFLNRVTESQGIKIGAYNAGYTISGNSFYETTSFTSSANMDYSVIMINTATGLGNGFTVSGNYIGGRSALCGGTAWTKTGGNNVFYGINLNTATGTVNSIQGNTIQNINWTNSGATSTTFRAINLSGEPNVNVGTVTGNTIGDVSGTGSIQFTAGAGGSMFLGINIASTGTVDCRNNNVGSILAKNSGAGNHTSFYGIQKSIASGAVTIIGNTVGSTITAGSINASSPSTVGAQLVVGIRSIGTGAINITGNTVANMVNATRNTTAATAGSINGINVTSGTCTISGNLVRDLSIANANNSNSTASSAIGIVLSALANAAQTVQNNTIYNLSNSYADFEGSVIGISYDGKATASTIRRNFIHSLSVTGATSTAANLYGIRIIAGAATYSNNIISLGGDTKTNIYGIYETGAATNNLYYNTVYISGSLSSGSANTSYALYSALSTNTRNFRNNVLVNARSTASGASKHYAFYAAATGGSLTCDYNNYNVSGTGGVLGYYGGDKTSLPIVSSVTGNDVYSIATNPTFLDIGTNAYGFAPNIQGTAVAITGTTIDYSGNTRNATSTSMGAIEVVSWTGTAGMGWNTAANWSTGAVPVTSTTVLNIPAGSSNDPTLSGSITCNALFLAPGAGLNLNGQTLTLNLDLKNNGSITGSGKLKMAGTAAQTISGSGTISHLEIDNSTGVTITGGVGNMQTITSKITPTTGTLTTNGNLTLRSDINGTARVLQGSASGGYISGDVVTQRYLTKLTGTGRNGRAWRLMTIPVTGTGTLRDLFMAGQPGTNLTVSANQSAQPNGLGTVVIGHNQPSASAATGAGFDWIGTAGQVSSLRYYQQNATSGSFASSQVPTLTTTYSAADQGYMLFARGDRQQTYNGTGNSSATVLQATGELKQGQIDVTIPALASAGFVLVGNPYMALLDLEKVILDNAGVIDNTVYVWDANIDGNAFRQGGYRAVTRTGVNTWSATGGSTGANPQYIESGSAFFVKPTATGGTLSIKESHKVDGTPGIAPHSSMTDGPSRLFINLEVTDTANRRLVDGAVAFFDTNYKDGLGDAVDIVPMTNLTAGSITLRQSGVRLSMDGRPWPADSTARTIPVDMRNLGDDAYVLRILPTNMNKEGLTAWLKDRHLNQETSVKLDEETLYSFRRTGDLGVDSSRFEIVYRLSKPTNAGTLTPDAAAGEIGLRLYPNPARSSDVKLSLGTLAPGRYEVQVLDISGRLVMTRSIQHMSSTSEHRILQGQKLSTGQYLIRVFSNDRPLHILELIHN